MDIPSGSENSIFFSSSFTIVDHDKFAKMRAEHYHMKEALKLGHQLAEEELSTLESPSSAGPVPPLPSFALHSNESLKGKPANKDTDVHMS